MFKIKGSTKKILGYGMGTHRTPARGDIGHRRWHWGGVSDDDSDDTLRNDDGNGSDDDDLKGQGASS